jgi:hypothetical protein
MVVDGRVAVMVPPAGMSVSGDGIGTHGNVSGLTVTNTGKTVRAVRGAHGTAGGGWFLAPLSSTNATTRASTPTSTTTSTTISTTISTFGTITTARASSPPACRDRTFHLEHHKWKTALRYRVNLSKMPRRYHKKVVTRQIRVANGNMRKGRNTCGKPRLRTPASHYLGHTSKRPNIRAAGPTCGRPNARNVVGFGNLPGGLLGWTCFWWYGSGRIAGADMLVDTGANLTTHLPRNCVNKWDFEGVVTHEWGHAYGLAHTGSGHAHLTMQHLLTPCSTYARTLGLGDWLGMNKMYGHRR